MRFKFLIAYDGTGYSGWQIQEKPCSPPTIQGTVEAALFKIAQKRIRVFGAGRTDAGVHAHGQAAHCDIPDAISGINWRQALNAILPYSIRILDAVPVGNNFHARYSAISKTYVYSFWQEKAFLPPQLRNYVWNCGQLDIDSMRGALDCLTGEHDFASFQNAGTKIKTTIRNILNASIMVEANMQYYPSHLQLLRLTVTGSGFLKQMARNIAGCIAFAGKGKIKVSSIPAIIAARDRRKLPSPTAPGCGLALAHVEYPREQDFRVLSP